MTAPASSSLLATATGRIRALQDELERRRRAEHDEIAVVGVGARFPGCAPGVDGFWRALLDGRDCLVDPPAERVRPGGAPAGLLPGVDRFDAAFFGIDADEARHMDPQQRIALEVAWEAVEDAGLPVGDRDGSDVGVFVGVYQSDYLLGVLSGHAATAYTGPGNAHSAIANRISHRFGLVGPSLAVDTACSSSLVAVHMAVTALQRGECAAALVGGVNLLLAARSDEITGRTLPIAAGGRCRSFDAAADGIVRSEGCAFVVLRRLSDAQDGGDRVYATILGSAVNHDGRSNGFTAPNPRAQQAAITRALTAAGVTAADVDYVEAHGTGTPLGDPIEADALAATYGRRDPGADVPCRIGAVKANLGHPEACAGIAGLVKTVLCVQRGHIPAIPHLRRPNPHLALEGTRLRLATEAAPWPDRPGRRRRAAVSSFGFGGTNAHVVVGAAPDEPADARVQRPAVAAGAPLALPVSARSAAAAAALARAYRGRLRGADAAAVGGLVHAAATRGPAHPHRVAAVGASAAELVDDLAGAVPRRAADGRVAFVFGGQGSGWVGMARDLAAVPAFAAVLDECDASLAALSETRVRALLEHGDAADLARTDQAQLVLFAVQVGLAAVLQDWGIRPRGVVGHSVGEVSAAHVAGALDLDAAIRLVHARGRILHRMAAGGRMLAAAVPESAVPAVVRGTGVVLAAVNSPTSVVVSGEASEVAKVAARLADQGTPHRYLPVDYAFHSAMLAEAPAALRREVGPLAPAVGRLPLYSTRTGTRVGGDALDIGHWAAAAAAPVRFLEATTALIGDGVDLLVEISPRPVHLRDITHIAETARSAAPVVAAMVPDAPARRALLTVAARAWVQGADVDWARCYGGRAPHVDLPPHPWDRRSFWVGDPPSSPASSESPESPESPVAAAPEAVRTDDVVEFLRAQIVAVAGGDVDVDAPIDELAVDSLVVVELRNRAEARFGISVSLSTMLAGGSLRDVAARAVGRRP